MIIAKKNRLAIYEALFKDGVMTAIKDFNLPKHSELEKIRNLEVIKAMQVSIFLKKFEAIGYTCHYYYNISLSLLYISSLAEHVTDVPPKYKSIF